MNGKWVEPQWACPDSVQSDVHHGRCVPRETEYFFVVIFIVFLGTGHVWLVIHLSMDMENKDWSC